MQVFIPTCAKSTEVLACPSSRVKQGMIGGSLGEEGRATWSGQGR